MRKEVSIILYHYVRDLKNSRYSGINGLDTDLFKKQIAFLKKHYTIITMEQMIDSIDNKILLPPKSALLTFDDAYIDHFTQVFPILIQNDIQGSFYPPVKAIKEHIVLDVNKIHHIIASKTGNDKIIAEIFNLLDHYREEYHLEPNEYYYKRYAVADRFDTADTIFIKRLLQRGLDKELRKIIINLFFEEIVGISETAFSFELYMNVDQIKTLKQFGMHIGSHAYDHYWLDSLPKQQQEEEIQKSLEFLDEVGADMNNWTMSYPYGGFNNNTIEILKKYNCKLALTCEMGVAQASIENRFTLERLDTNDIPKD